MKNNTKSDIALLKEKTKNLSVLYVEDEEYIRNKTVYLLNKLFQSIEVASDGKEGLDKYLKGDYDIVITDIVMPHMDGLELINNIQKKDSNQSVIIMSALTEPELIDKAKALNIKNFIDKPININQLIDVLNSSIDELDILK